MASATEGLEVKIAPDWAPNVFASVVMVSGRQGPLDRDRPMMKMGVVELKVSAEQRRLQVAIATDREKYEPGDTVTGTVTVTSAGKPVSAEVAVSAADEGVLSLIDYRTPDPMKTFYASFGLGVDAGTNWNRIARLADPGAEDPDEGGDGGSEGGKIRSRFVASAYWAPALVTDARGVATFSFTAPDSLTAYRLMAVAADAGDRFGNGERRVTVTKKLIAQPVLPRFKVRLPPALILAPLIAAPICTLPSDSTENPDDTVPPMTTLLGVLMLPVELSTSSLMNSVSLTLILCIAKST